MTAPVRDCASFDEASTDLALGFTSEPERDALLAHAASCPRCGRLLADLGATVDGLLGLAPEAEPPVGFESRAVARIGSGGGGTDRRGFRIPAWSLVAGVVVVLGLIAALGLAWGGDGDRPGRHGVVAASIRSAQGADVGDVVMIAGSPPRIVVVVDGPDDWPGTWVCELLVPGSRWTAVGRWRAPEAAGGTWTTTMAESLLRSTQMRITTEAGRVVATATFAAG